MQLKAVILSTKNAPKIAYSNLRFQQNLPREKPPDPGASTPLTDGSRIKGKVFPYSLTSVGPGADPGVQAVSPQVT